MASDLWIVLTQAAPIILTAFFVGAEWSARREHRAWMQLYERSNEVILSMLRQLLRDQVQADCEEATDG